uniref:F-box domain-containing protein n=1 Tax=Ditylenchus dipsaci TaxID=166011 RepID=A0A915E601_9BILA
MDFFYRRLGKLIVPPVSYIPPLKILGEQSLVNVLSFFKRQELDELQLVSKQFHHLISHTFVDHPYRCFHTLDVQIDAAKESPPCKVDFTEAKSTLLFLSFFECLEIFQDKKNSRFKHTRFMYARKLPLDLNDELDEFLVTFSHLTHLWQGHKLDVFMMPWDRPRAAHLEEYLLTLLQILFDYPDVKVTSFLKVDAFAPPNNLVSEAGAMLHYLHIPFYKCVWMTFTKGGDQLFFKQIVAELRKRFQSSSEPCTYILYLIGLHNARFYSIQPFVLDNQSTGEQFIITKETGDFNMAYKIVRWQVQERQIEKTKKNLKKRLILQ